MQGLPRRFGRYELIECVSSTESSEIHRARLPGGTRDFALKTLPPNTSTDSRAVASFHDEARVAETIRHKFAARMVEHGEAEGQTYLLFEWIDGVTLEELLSELMDRGQMMPIDQAARLFARVAETLEALHATVDASGARTEFVHRDITPANILIDFDGDPYVVDFGLAHSTLQRAKVHSALVVGKPGYLAPEQLDGHVDARTDVFALGVCLYEALTGARPFGYADAASARAVFAEQRGVASIRALRPEVPEALDEFVVSLLARDPADRPSDMSEVKRGIYGAMPSVLLSGEDLDEVTGGLVGRYFRTRSPVKRAPERSTPAPTSPEAVRTRRTWPWVLVAVVLLALGMVAVAVSAR